MCLLLLVCFFHERNLFCLFRLFPQQVRAMEEEVHFPVEEALLHDTRQTMQPVRMVFDPHNVSNAEPRKVGAFGTAKWTAAAVQRQAESDAGLAPPQYISVGPTSQLVTPAAQQYLNSHTNYLQTSQISASTRDSHSIGIPTAYGLV